jgi:hypothetical protein
METFNIYDVFVITLLSIGVIMPLLVLIWTSLIMHIFRAVRDHVTIIQFDGEQEEEE